MMQYPVLDALAKARHRFRRRFFFFTSRRELLEQEATDFGQRMRVDLLLNQGDDGFRHPFSKLEKDVSDKSITHHHIGHPVRNIAAFNIANKIGTYFRISSEAASVSSLPLEGSSPIDTMPTFGAGRLKTHFMNWLPMIANCKRCLGLQSTFAPASVMTQNPWSVGMSVVIAGRDTPGDVFKMPERRRHRGAGIARRDHRIRPPLRDEFGREHDGGIRLGTAGLCRTLVHFHDRITGFDIQRNVFGAQAFEFRLKGRRIADERDFTVQACRSLNGTFHNQGRSSSPP